MKSTYSVDDLNRCAIKAQQILLQNGCATDIERKVENGKYIYIFTATNGKQYITGMDNKTGCMLKLERICKNPLYFIEYCFN